MRAHTHTHMYGWTQLQILDDITNTCKYHMQNTHIRTNAHIFTHNFLHIQKCTTYTHGPRTWSEHTDDLSPDTSMSAMLIVANIVRRAKNKSNTRIFILGSKVILFSHFLHWRLDRVTVQISFKGGRVYMCWKWLWCLTCAWYECKSSRSPSRLSILPNNT